MGRCPLAKRNVVATMEARDAGGNSRQEGSGARKETGVTSVTTEEKVHTETVEVKGDDLLAKVKEIVHEGNVRRITITDKEGHRLMEIPLTVGVVGVVLLPVFAAVGALAALVAECTIEVQRVETK
jgi:hypothetical protein